LIPYFKSLDWDRVSVGDFVDGSNRLRSSLGHRFEALFYCLVVRFSRQVGVKNGPISQ